MFTALRLHLAHYLRDDSGAVAVEYAIIAVAMFLAIIPSFLSISGAVEGKLNTIAGYFNGF